MARDVNDVIIDIVTEYKKVAKSSAADFVKSKFNPEKKSAPYYQTEVSTFCKIFF